MQEELIKTHLIITDVHEEYNIKWHGKIANVSPLLINNKPVFVLISSTTRLELNTIDIKYIEKCAKQITFPRGKSGTTTDKTRIYIKSSSGEEIYIGTVEHKHIKTYAPMYDKVGYK